MLSTGEMIDSLRVGEKAEVAKYPPYVLNFREDAYVINDGSRFLWDDGDQFMINSSTKNIKWRIIPQFVSFQEAMKEIRKGKTAFLHNDRLSDEPIPFDDEDATFELKHHKISNYSLKELINGNWSVEQ